jgi:hypothetical protein
LLAKGLNLGSLRVCVSPQDFGVVFGNPNLVAKFPLLADGVPLQDRKLFIERFDCRAGLLYKADLDIL